jgi:rifampicin phosphotransferase
MPSLAQIAYLLVIVQQLRLIAANTNVTRGDLAATSSARSSSLRNPWARQISNYAILPHDICHVQIRMNYTSPGSDLRLHCEQINENTIMTRENTMLDDEKHYQVSNVSETPLVLSLTALDASMLPLVGGKAANLGELIRADFPVPRGFCVTTAAYALLNDAARLEPLLAELAATGAGDTESLRELAAAIRAALLHAPIPTSVIKAITEAYRALCNGDSVPVAVRSSATAEDLPYASFAGQQETYLNIIGIEAVLTVVQRCWASLWTERAINYRASLDIDHRTVNLAVVVQCMVDAQVAGVLFTANPLTGKRREIVIDANPGLGEAVVSGMTNPDHFVINIPSGEIIERHLGGKQVIIQAISGGGTKSLERATQSQEACLSDIQVGTLAELGSRIEALYGAPQDIEWSIDATGHIFVLQARPITTLFPLPAGAPSTDQVLRVYLSFNVQQGTYRPFTPMGISAIRLLASSITTLFGFPPRLPLQGPSFVTEAASRIFFDVTAALRRSFGRQFLLQAMEQAEVHAAEIFQQLTMDPRLSLLPTPRFPFLRAIMRLLVRTRLPWNLFRALLSPRSAHIALQRYLRTLRSASEIHAHVSAATRLSSVERLLLEATQHLLRVASPTMLGGMLTFDLAGRLLGDDAQESELQVVLRGAPFNPTTEMNLALWSLAKQVQTDPATTRLVQNTPPARLAEDYQHGSLPPLLQRGLANFLVAYGHRSVAELDLGVPRWSEEPTYVLGILASYAAIRDSALAPDVQFQRAAQEARAMMVELTRRAKRKSWLRGLLLGFCLRRAHALGGLREMPRFCGSLLLAQARTLLYPVGEELVRAGRLEAAEDIFFMSLPEAHQALAGSDLRALVSTRHTVFERELARRHVPLVLLSDGTEPDFRPDITGSMQDPLRGTPASPGVVTASARVVLDPHDAHLKQGEILVAPSTDPGWTPLFLTAGGLVMEMGGAMAHGAIVAREYGIPAVVGVPHATKRITSGMRLTVDGTTGTILIEDSAEE